MKITDIFADFSVRVVLHWIAFGWFTYIFCYAGFFKVFKVPGMMNGMAAMGFNEGWTLAIGAAEVAGVTGLLIGMFIPPVKNVAVLWLMPFAIGALTVHISHQHTFHHLQNSLLVCIFPFIILGTDKQFSIVL